MQVPHFSVVSFTVLWCGISSLIPWPAYAQPLAKFGVTTRTPPEIRVSPPPKYWSRMRMWQGIPSLERTAGGRLWATWYAGPVSEGREGNYAVLVTSGDDGTTWSRPVAVFDPSLFGNGNKDGCIDPHLWIDPRGSLWWFVNRSLPVGDTHGDRSVWAFRAKNPEDGATGWDEPVFAGYGTALNKPLVLSNGDWLRPVDRFLPEDPLRTHYYVSKDGGRSYQLLSRLEISDSPYSEHMAVERKDGSLWMLARTKYGIAQAESSDRGRTWANERPFTTERGKNTRFFLRRLKSGALLLVLNDHRAQRARMTALLSEDEGATWPHALLLDERPGVSYPDGTEGSNGFLYVTYDRGRYAKGQQEILFAKFTEAEIKAGLVTNQDSRLQQLVSRLEDHGGGVDINLEVHRLLDEHEKHYESTRLLAEPRAKK